MTEGCALGLRHVGAAPTAVVRAAPIRGHDPENYTTLLYGGLLLQLSGLYRLLPTGFRGFRIIPVISIGRIYPGNQ
jgi:hypothetical protein